uniref:Uncharacterized protein n=1 Tax=Pyxicephalus adspersus TaxID=30357 RepID=A0AAV3AF25_PYXAD|nr:TPA: hypothetical protein GDO54_014510 [Pyxicephalus adspersus]
MFHSCAKILIIKPCAISLPLHRTVTHQQYLCPLSRSNTEKCGNSRVIILIFITEWLSKMTSPLAGKIVNIHLWLLLIRHFSWAAF